MRVLVAGVGSIGQRHIRNLRSRLGAGVEILAYRVRKLSHVLSDALEIVPGERVEAFHGLETFDQLDEALALKPDAVFVCNPTSLHVPVALAAARAGCHLFVEKPLSHSREGLADLIEQVERRGLVAMVGYQLRFHPALQRLRELVASRAVGRILAVRVEVAEHLPDAHPYEDYRQSYVARSDMGGGVALAYTHELDYLYWLFGLPRRLFALGGHLSTLEIDVEDTVAMTLEYVVEGRPVPVHVHQDFVQRPHRRTCRIVGEAGAIQLDLRAQTLTVTDCEGHVCEHRTFEHVTRNHLFVHELDHFLACMAGTCVPTVTLREGLQSLRMALAARESLRTGDVVKLQ